MRKKQEKKREKREEQRIKNNLEWREHFMKEKEN